MNSDSNDEFVKNVDLDIFPEHLDEHLEMPTFSKNQDELSLMLMCMSIW